MLNKLTQKIVREELRALGLSFRATDGEIKINFLNGAEATSYYTDDLQDALNTGRMMAATVSDL